MEGAARYKACVIGMPVKDTIKIADEEGNASHTPDRSTLWQIQTPQAFSYGLVRTAYDRLFENPSMERGITDDAMVVETMTKQIISSVTHGLAPSWIRTSWQPLAAFSPSYTE